MDGRDLAELTAARGKVVDALNHMARVERRLTDPDERAVVRQFGITLMGWLTHTKDGLVPYLRGELLGQ